MTKSSTSFSAASRHCRPLLLAVRLSGITVQRHSTNLSLCCTRTRSLAMSRRGNLSSNYC